MRRQPLLVLLALRASFARELSSRPALLQRTAVQPSLLALRGGEDDSTLPAEPGASAADQPLQLPTEEEEGDAGPSSAMSGCMAGVKKIIGLILSLFSPSYEYSKAGKDLLGDKSQDTGFDPEDESWRTQRKKLNVVELQAAVRKRVLRDLRKLKGETDLGVEVEDAECLTDWVVKIVGAKGTIYEGEIYRLRVRFHADYPTQPPEVIFMRPAPMHEHIYSDGKICLNILYNDWSPQLDVKSVCLSLLSMLSSAKVRARAHAPCPRCVRPLHAGCLCVGPHAMQSGAECALLTPCHVACARARRKRSARQTTTRPSSCRRDKRRATCNGSSTMTNAECLRTGPSSAQKRAACTRHSCTVFAL